MRDPFSTPWYLGPFAALLRLVALPLIRLIDCLLNRFR